MIIETAFFELFAREKHKPQRVVLARDATNERRAAGSHCARV
jgi:hypothetical protein